MAINQMVGDRVWERIEWQIEESVKDAYFGDFFGGVYSAIPTGICWIQVVGAVRSGTLLPAPAGEGKRKTI